MPEDNTNKPMETQESDSRETRGYWKRWIDAAKKAAKEHWADSKRAWDEYEHQSTPEADKTTVFKKTASYPIYWSSCKTIEPAYYSRTPQLNATRRFEINDPVALTGCQIVERLAKYLVERTDFDNVMMAAVGDYIHADKATLQVLYSADMEEQTEQMLLQMSPEGTYLTQNNEPYEGEVQQDEQGQIYYQSTQTIPRNKRISVAPICYDEILHTPEAKTQDEIKDIAYFFCMSEDEAKNRFPGKDIKFKTGKSYAEDKSAPDAETPGRYLEGWEIYCKYNKRVYWYSEQYTDDLLDVADDPYHLDGFFPSPPFIIGSKPAKSLYPTPAFIHCVDTVRQLHDQAIKVNELASKIQWAALIDGSIPELELAMKSLGNGDYIAVKNFQSILEKGGIQNTIYFLPIQELVTALNNLIALEDKFKQNFYEWFGVPDILRGSSDPVETAAAQEVKQASAHDRFKYQKKQIGRLASDAIQMMVDLALFVYDDMEIAEVTGYQYLDPADQQRFIPALQFLRNDKSRTIRIEVDTDSMSFLDQQLRFQRAGTAMQSVTQGLQAIAEAAKIHPAFAAVGVKALLTSLETMQVGRQFEEGVAQAAQQLLQQLQQPPQQPPPPPDYEAMKLQLQGQKQQMDMMLEGRKLQQKEQELAIKAQSENVSNSLKQLELQLQQQAQQMAMALEAQRVQIEEYKAKIQAAESEMEEIRLAHDSDNERVRTLLEAQKPIESTPPQVIAVQSPSGPPVTVNVEAPRDNQILPVL